MWFFVAILLWPLIEISLFITLGSWLGLWLSLLVILGTGLLGVAILRGMGMRAADDLRSQVRTIRDPGVPAARGPMRVIAALLLILPGFLTDALGLLLLIPVVQDLVLLLVVRRIAAGFTVTTAAGAPFGAPFGTDLRRGAPGGPVIDGDFIEIDPPTRSPGPPPGGGTPRTRH